mmetsp:Transcript_11107/g.29485  ORF Transcript_11107/g.29485 Transcript_11107/m.29485 type:complete len:247 (-) Transcript_11107:244-984(-)
MDRRHRPRDTLAREHRDEEPNCEARENELGVHAHCAEELAVLVVRGDEQITDMSSEPTKYGDGDAGHNHAASPHEAIVREGKVEETTKEFDGCEARDVTTNVRPSLEQQCSILEDDQNDLVDQIHYKESDEGQQHREHVWRPMVVHRILIEKCHHHAFGRCEEQHGTEKRHRRAEAIPRDILELFVRVIHQVEQRHHDRCHAHQHKGDGNGHCRRAIIMLAVMLVAVVAFLRYRATYYEARPAEGC